MKAKIKEKKEVAEGTLMVSFEAKEKINFKPGQYFYITLINPPYNDLRGARRHFSIVNPPDTNIITMTTRLGPSALKRSLREMSPGSPVELDSIGGDFTLPEKADKPLVFIAGGIGITPFMSMLRYIKDGQLPYRVTLVYSNRDRELSAYLEELEKMDLELDNFRLIATMTDDSSWRGESRRVDAGFIKEYIPRLNESTYYVAGPPKMVESLSGALTEAGVQKSNIKIENFTGY